VIARWSALDDVEDERKNRSLPPGRRSDRMLDESKTVETDDRRAPT
jgi:hypothetical protein